MDMNQNPTRTMAQRITDIGEKVCRVLSAHCEMNRISMNIVHSLGYNGFKRWHRHRARQFLSLKLALENSLYDKFRIRADFKDEEVNYAPDSMQAHLRSWDAALLEAVKTLGEANKEYWSEAGACSKAIRKAMRIMVKDYECVGRLLKRFNGTEWLAIGVHMVDDRLHEKFKRKEERHGR